MATPSSSILGTAIGGLVLTQPELNELLSGQTVYIGNSNLLNTLLVGDGSGTTVTLPGPTTVLSGTSVTFLSPAAMHNLIIDGDGSTTTIDAPITSTTGVEINDGVLVTGTQTVTGPGRRRSRSRRRRARSTAPRRRPPTA